MMILMKLNMILIFINHIILMIMILMFLFDIVLILFNANIGIKTSIDIAINYAFFMWSTSEEYGNIYIYILINSYIYIFPVGLKVVFHAFLNITFLTSAISSPSFSPISLRRLLTTKLLSLTLPL